MARARRGDRKRFGRQRKLDAPFDDSSSRDLVQIVGDHLIEGENAAATAKWYPSRRGNSPHHRS
jgi:hypothetical protein